MKKLTAEEKKQKGIESLNYLASFIVKHKISKVYVVNRYASKTEPRRVFSLFLIVNNEPVRITHHVAHVLDYKYDQEYCGVVCEGGGMDMGFEVVYSFWQQLYAMNSAIPQLKHEFV